MTPASVVKIAIVVVSRATLDRCRKDLKEAMKLDHGPQRTRLFNRVQDGVVELRRIVRISDSLPAKNEEERRAAAEVHARIMRHLGEIEDMVNEISPRLEA